MRASDDVVATLRWLGGIARTRLTGTPDERAAQDAIAARLEGAGYDVSWHTFRYPRHIYGSLALHFGLALALLALPWPRVAAAGHALVAISFFSEATRRGMILRHLWPKVASQNLLATLPARGPMRRRLVFLAHVDSAYTGFLFRPNVLKALAAPPPSFLPFLRKQLALPLAGVAALAVYELASAYLDLPRWPAYALALPALPVFLLNAQIVLRNEVVPGAADNLTGCAAQVVLAEAYAKQRADDVEVVFGFTGAEEAGTGGAFQLAKAMKDTWSREDTEVIILDTLSNGDLFQLEEGELYRITRPPELVAAVDAASTAAGFGPVPMYIVPAGGTDALPFLAMGYRAIALTCIDPEQNAPRGYHHPSDTVENVDPAQLVRSTDVAFSLLTELAGVKPNEEGEREPERRAV